MADLIAEFEVFRQNAARCRKVFDTHCKLFHNDHAATKLLVDLAHHFFFDLSHWLADYHVILVTRLTDPAKTMGKANLTSEYLVEELRDRKMLSPEISQTSNELRMYRAKVVVWRNKIIAHSDLAVALSPAQNNGHEFDEVVAFHVALDRFCLLVGDQLGARHLTTIRIAEGTRGVTSFLMKIRRCLKDAR